VPKPVPCCGAPAPTVTVYPVEGETDKVDVNNPPAPPPPAYPCPAEPPPANTKYSTEDGAKGAAVVVLVDVLVDVVEVLVDVVEVLVVVEVGGNVVVDVEVLVLVVVEVGGNVVVDVLV
jgi:hypothetical protein